MKTIKITLVTLGLLVVSVAGSYAQIKIGTNPTSINENSLLEVESDKKGILLPRLKLQSAILAAPLTAHVAGMIIYNTEIAGTAPNNVEPGLYYNNGSRWVKLKEIFDATTTEKGVIQLAGDLTGTATAPVIATGKITSDKILDGTIATDDVADGAVTTAKIDNLAVNNAKLAADAVTTDKILNSTIKNEDLNKTDIPLSGFAAATANVDLGSQKLINVQDPTAEQDAATKKYVDDATTAINTLTDGKLYIGNASNVATEVIMTGDVTISNAGVTTIGASKVLSGMIADGTIITADLADSAVETAKILDANVTPAKIAPGTANQILVTNGTPAVEWFTPTNTLTATNGQLVSTVNGLASTDDVKVLISADNGLTVTNGKVQLGGALTAATTITTDATNKLALAGLQDGVNTDKMLVVDGSGVVKSVSANARNVLGIVKTNTAYTVVDADHTILADAGSAAFTITLPAAAAANKGRVLLIRKTDETNNVLTFSESIKYSETTSITTLNYLSTIRIQSDGTAWYKID